MNGTRSVQLFTSILSSPAAYWLVSIELRDCELQTAEMLSHCVNLRSAYLPGNHIKAVPQCITRMQKLAILDLRRNEVADFEEGLRYLRFASKKLEVFILTGNPICGLAGYRAVVNAVLPSLMVLDSSLLSALELHPVLQHYYDPPRVPVLLREYRVVPTMKISRVVDLQLLFVHRIERRARCCLNALLDGMRRFSYNYRLKQMRSTVVRLQARSRAYLKRAHLRIRLRAMCDEAGVDYGDEFDDARANANRIDENRARREYYSVKIQRAVREFQLWKRYDRAVRVIQRLCVEHMVSWRQTASWIRSVGTSSFYVVRQLLPEVYEALSRLEDMHWSFPGLAVENVGGFYQYKTVQHDELGMARAKTMFVANPVDTPQRVATGLWRTYASPEQRHLLRHFPPYGSFVSGSVRLRWKARMRDYTSLFLNKFSAVTRVACSDPAALQMLFSEVSFVIRQMPTGLARPTDPKWDCNVKLEIAVLCIQKMYRGVKMRTNMMTLFLQGVLSNRAIRALQRWWRMRAGLHRRMRLLSHSARACRAITSPTVFMDAWAFYTLIRRRTMPVPPHSVRLYPENAGFPALDTAGLAAFVASSTVHGRLGGARWAFPIPLVRANSRPGPRSEQEFLPREVLVGGSCSVSVRTARAAVPPDADELEIRRLGQLSYRVIQLDYPSVKEARARVAALVNLTYDYGSEVSAAPVPLSTLLHALDAVQREVANAFHGSVAHTPESTVSLLAPPPLVVATHAKDDMDLLRFRFLLETLGAAAATSAQRGGADSMGMVLASQVTGGAHLEVQQGMKGVSLRAGDGAPSWSKLGMSSQWTLINDESTTIVTEGSIGDVSTLLAEQSYALNPSVQASLLVESSLRARGASHAYEAVAQSKGLGFYLPPLVGPCAGAGVGLGNKAGAGETLDLRLCSRHVWEPLKAVMWCSEADSVATQAAFATMPGHEEHYSHSLLQGGSGGGGIITRLNVLQAARDAAESEAKTAARKDEARLVKGAEASARAVWSKKFSQMEGERNELVERDLMADVGLSARQRYFLNNQAKVARLKVTRARVLEQGRMAQEAEMAARLEATAHKQAGAGAPVGSAAAAVAAGGGHAPVPPGVPQRSLGLETAAVLARDNSALRVVTHRSLSGHISELPPGSVSEDGDGDSGTCPKADASGSGGGSGGGHNAASFVVMNGTGLESSIEGSIDHPPPATATDGGAALGGMGAATASSSAAANPVGCPVAPVEPMSDSIAGLPKPSSRAKMSAASVLNVREAERIKRAAEIRKKTDKKKRAVARHAEATSFGKAQGKLMGSVARRMETMMLKHEVQAAREEVLATKRAGIAAAHVSSGDSGFTVTVSPRPGAPSDLHQKAHAPSRPSSTSCNSSKMRHLMVNQRILKLKIDSELRIPNANMVSLANLYLDSLSNVEDGDDPSAAAAVSTAELMRSLSIDMDGTPHGTPYKANSPDQRIVGLPTPGDAECATLITCVTRRPGVR